MVGEGETLVLSSASPSDVGAWVCRVENSAGHAHLTYDVTVMTTPLVDLARMPKEATVLAPGKL